MNFVVVGSGIVGVTTAYLLQRLGHAVTVIDREEAPGRKASFANGGLLTPSMSEPWNRPGITWELIRSLLDPARYALSRFRAS
jgi:D-amino-acid dehydrogenase